MSAWWQQTAREVCKQLNTDPEKGLSYDEVKRRLEIYGKNSLPTEKRFSAIRLFLGQFDNYMVWVLLGALLFALLSGLWIDAASIGVVVFINTLLGFFQEYKAERALSALQRLTKPHVRVVRDGKMHRILSDTLVPGDYVMIESGDVISADGRVITSFQLATQESAMTGESISVLKTVDPLSDEKLMIGERTNMVFMGTSVVTGKGAFIVTRTGLQTELGKIAESLETVSAGKSPLEKHMQWLGYWLLGGCLMVIIGICFMGLIQGESLTQLILSSVSTAIAAIPEGLPAVISVALAIAVTRMAKRNALVRRLAVIDTLGAVTIICADKTGTLTQNEMVVTDIWTNGTLLQISGQGYAPDGNFTLSSNIINPADNGELMSLLEIAVSCNSAHLFKRKGRWQIMGDPTEAALLTAAAKAGLEKDFLERELPLIAEFPFDSQRKRMSVVRMKNGTRVLFVKGAPDSVLALCSLELFNGQPIPLSPENLKKHGDANENLARRGLRVLALAYRDLSADEAVSEMLEKDLIFVGFMAMEDPLRPEASDAIEKCKKAGIRTVMITGDYKETALAIAKQAGLTENNVPSLDGKELDQMSDEQLAKIASSILVYARVTPEHKLRIVRALRASHEVVAMTGDGVNDAPAIKMADVGIAMGTGTEIAKEASDMIIVDDNFVSIVHAIEEGRGVYDNLLTFMSYLISSNIAELMVIFMGAALGFLGFEGIGMLTPIQILWLNLISDGPPALALAFDPLDPQLMRRPPRRLSQSLISGNFALELLFVAFIIAVGALIAGSMGDGSLKLSNTLTLTTLIALEFVRVSMVRAYSLPLFSNPWLIAALLCSMCLQLCILYVPFLQRIFKTVPLSIAHWLAIVSIVLVVWAIGMVLRVFSQQRKS